MANQYPYPPFRIPVPPDGQLNGIALNQQSTEFRDTLSELRDGKVNTAGTVTLSAGATVTAVSSSFMDALRVVHLSPRNAGAIALSPFVSGKSSGAFTLSHSTATGGEIYDWIIMG